MMFDIALLVAKGTALIVCAWVVVALASRGKAAGRHGVLAALFVALLLLPLVPRLVPPVNVEVPASTPRLDLSPEELEASPAIEGSAPPSPVAGVAGEGMDLIGFLPAVYLGGLSALLVVLAAGVWRLRRWANDAEMWPEGMSIATAVAADARIRRGVLVVLSDELAVPLTFGFRRQTIVMPAAAQTWPAEEVRRAIRHELEHVRRDDWAMQLIARVACAVWWPHPMVWLALRRFCVEAERACDDAVVRSAEAHGYADQLVTLARTLGRAPRVPALSMASPSRLAERVHAILDAKQRRGPQSRTGLVLTAGLIAALAVTVGSVQVVAAAAPDIVIDDEDDADAYRDAIVGAAGKGNIRALEAFAQAGVDLNAAIIGDGTPLLIAARHGRIEAVRWLLDRGVDPNEPSPGDGNALIAAAAEGQTGIMQILLDRGARIEDVVPGDENALITAAAAGSDQAVELLIRRGADVNARVWADGREWRTPLNMARRNGHGDIVRILLEAGARE